MVWNMGFTKEIFILWQLVSGVLCVKVTQAPTNIAVHVGSNLDLPCAFDEFQYELKWAKCEGVSVCPSLFRDGTPLPGVPTNQRYARYSVVNRTTTNEKRYDFRIENAQLEDSGRFLCLDSTNALAASAYVIVIENRTSCVWNATAPYVIRLGSDIRVSCDVTYGGQWAPMMRFLDPSKARLPGVENGTLARGTTQYSVTSRAARTSGRYVMEAFFNPIPLQPDDATNTPKFPAPASYGFEPLTVWYSPQNVSICPREDWYQVGDAVTCLAEANPTPSYIWTDRNNASHVTSRSQLKITRTMVDVPQRFRCEACNYVFGTRVCARIDVAFAVSAAADQRVAASYLLGGMTLSWTWIKCLGLH